LWLVRLRHLEAGHVVLRNRGSVSQAEKLGQSKGSVRLPRPGDRRERGEDGLSLVQLYAGDITNEARVPAKGGAAVLLRSLVAEQEEQLEAIGEAEGPEFRGASEGVGDATRVRGTGGTARRPNLGKSQTYVRIVVTAP
jgi:hypothetical protein